MGESERGKVRGGVRGVRGRKVRGKDEREGE